MKVNSKKKKNKTDISTSFRYMIPGIVALILLVVIFLETNFVPKQALGSIYNINDLETNFDNIQIGDTVNYEINGYSDWQVIGKDDYEGTIDVVSKTNTEDLTLEYNRDKEYYENIFQETANKYTDNNYAISSRTVNEDDLDYFSYEEKFLLNELSESTIATSQGTVSYVIDMSDIDVNHKLYVIPYVVRENSTSIYPNIGDTVDYFNNGIDTWKYFTHSNGDLLIPQNPIEIEINNTYDDINKKVNQIIESYNNEVLNYGNLIDFTNKFGGPNNLEGNISECLGHFLNQQTERVYFIGSSCWQKQNHKIVYTGCDPTYYYEDGEFHYINYGDAIYADQDPKILIGYRPVVTLKLRQEINDKKEISDEIKVGDNVKYEAGGYKNWKVISTDKEDNTADIISGGIVKNLTLSGKDDWDNYEEIIQSEVDEYKNGDNATKATTISTSDLETLKKIDHSTLPRYWVLTKNTYIRQSYSLSSSRADLLYYNIGSINLYKYDNYDMYIDYVTIYAEYKGDQNAVDYYNNDYYKNKINSSSYTAGLRPVIRMRLDDIEKLSNKEKKKIEEESARLNKVLENEQSNKNKNYKGSIKKNDSTNYTGNSDTISSDDSKSNTNNKNIVYKDNPFYKYGFFTLLVTCIGETVYIFIPKKHKSKRKHKK